jgi:TolA-binding protein
MHNLENKDTVLKIFSRIRCFNRDQLPRYVDGRLTHVEKHLLEQHLVNCELCSDAIQILQKPKYKTQHQSMGLKVQQYIRKSTAKAPLVNVERYQRKEKTKESVLIYFWGTAAAALLICCGYLIQQQVKKENTQKSFAKVEKGVTPVAEREESIGTPPPASVATVAAPIVTPALKEEAVKAVAEETSDMDKSRYKTAMTLYMQGKLDEAMPRFTELTTATASRYSELARYQLAICFKFKGQKAKARNMFKELVTMNSSLKRRAQLALNKF